MNQNEILLEILKCIKSLSSYCCAPEPQHSERMREIYLQCQLLEEQIWKSNSTK
jgi:hypothetical protein